MDKQEQKELAAYLADKLKVVEQRIYVHIDNFYEDKANAKEDYDKEFGKRYSQVHENLTCEQIYKRANDILNKGEETVSEFFNYYGLSGVLKAYKRNENNEEMNIGERLTTRQWNLLKSAIVCAELYDEDIVNPNL